MHKLHPSVLQWLDRDNNYLTERWSCYSLCRWKQVRTVSQLVNWITHSWLELTFHQATDTQIQYTRCPGQNKLYRYQTFFPPEHIHHALSIRKILAQETQPFHKSWWFESTASFCFHWQKSAGIGWEVCLALHQSGFIGMDMLSPRVSLFTGMNEIMLSPSSNLLQSAFTLWHQWKECSASPCRPAVM